MTVYFNRTYFDIHCLHFSSDRRCDRATRRKLWQSKTDNIQDHIEVCFNNILSLKTDNKILTNYAYSTRIESVILLHSTSFIRRAFHCSLHMKDQTKFMQIQYQSSMMKISYDRELQETLLLSKQDIFSVRRSKRRRPPQTGDTGRLKDEYEKRLIYE